MKANPGLAPANLGAGEKNIGRGGKVHSGGKLAANPTRARRRGPQTAIPVTRRDRSSITRLSMDQPIEPERKRPRRPRSIESRPKLPFGKNKVRGVREARQRGKKGASLSGDMRGSGHLRRKPTSRLGTRSGGLANPVHAIKNPKMPVNADITGGAQAARNDHTAPMSQNDEA